MTNTTTAPAIHLQGIGLTHAKPASSLRAGDVTVWNCGYLATVVSVEEVSPKFLNLVTLSEGASQTFTRRVGKSRLIGVTRGSL